MLIRKGESMKKKSIFKQLLFPMIIIVCILAVSLSGIIVIVFARAYERELYERSQDKTLLVSGEIATFLEGAYGITEELSVNPSILTMDTKLQNSILSSCVERNPYLELLYIQGTDGMQTGRSSGALADRSTRWWFIQTMEEQKPFISKSYYSVNTGMPCASIFFPMYQDGSLSGIFAADLKLDYLQSIIEEFSDFEQGEYSFVIDGEGVVVAHPDSTQIAEQYNYKALIKTVSSKNSNGDPLTDAQGNIVTEEQSFSVSDDYRQMITDVMNGAVGSRKLVNNGDVYYASYAPISLKGSSDQWSVITLQQRSAAMSLISRIILIAIAVSAFAIGAAILVIAFLAGKLTGPIVSITRLIGNASEGDFTTRADERSRNEIGALSRSFNKMISKIACILVRLTTFTGEVIQSSGQLKDIEEHMTSLNTAVQEISGGTHLQHEEITQIVSLSEKLQESFHQLQQQSHSLLKDADHTMVSGKTGISHALGLTRQNELTAQKMEASYTRILELEKQSIKIADIVHTINSISSQTKLLALNASIEAAHSGEHGRGFAVVAESIGQLAADTNAATADIEAIITDLCQNIAAVVSHIDEIKNGSQEQTLAVEKVTGAFSELKSLAEQTKRSVSSMEALVSSMYDCDISMLHSVDEIREISRKAEQLTDEASVSLAQQLEGIRHVSRQIDNLSQVSASMEQEMTKFKLS